jgi:hypothetical protein
MEHARTFYLQFFTLTNLVQSLQAQIATPTTSDTQAPPVADPQAPLKSSNEPSALALVEGLGTRLSTKYPNPEMFTGEKDKLDFFLAQLKLKLLVNRDRYPNEPDRVAYTISRLGGNALKQVTPFISAGNLESLESLATLGTVIEILQRAYGIVDRHAEAIRKLRNLKQRNREFVVYYSEFERYMADYEYNDQEKVDYLLEGLSDELLSALKNQPTVPCDYQELVALLARIDASYRRFLRLQAVNQTTCSARTQPNTSSKTPRIKSRLSSEPRTSGTVTGFSYYPCPRASI